MRKCPFIKYTLIFLKVLCTGNQIGVIELVLVSAFTAYKWHPKEDVVW
jgi:hypothetical protein